MLAVARTACLLLLLLAAVPPALADKVLTEDAFTGIFIDTLTEQAPALAVTQRGPLHLSLKHPDGREQQALLDNAYRTYLAQPGALDAILQGYIEPLRAPAFAAADVDPSHVFPVLQRLRFIDDLRATNPEADSDWTPPAHDPYNAELMILYVADSAREMRYLTEKQLAEMGFSQSDRRARAVGNLRAQLPQLQVQSNGGYHIVAADGNYESSLLLVDALWQGDQLPVEGDPVVAIPSRSILIVTGSENAPVVAGLRAFAADTVASESYPLSGQLFIYRDGRFVPFGG